MTWQENSSKNKCNNRYFNSNMINKVTETTRTSKHTKYHSFLKSRLIESNHCWHTGQFYLKNFGVKNSFSLGQNQHKQVLAKNKVTKFLNICLRLLPLLGTFCTSVSFTHFLHSKVWAKL